MSIFLFLLILALSVAAVIYPLLPGPRARLVAAYRAPVVADREIEQAVRRLRRTRTSAGPACPSCGAAYQAGDRFCVGCGGKLPGSEASPTGRTCPACQAPIQMDDSFCPKCGTAIPAGEVA